MKGEEGVVGEEESEFGSGVGGEFFADGAV